jgi:hypothetical protein
MKREVEAENGLVSAITFIEGEACRSAGKTPPTR